MKSLSIFCCVRLHGPAADNPDGKPVQQPILSRVFACVGRNLVEDGRRPAMSRVHSSVAGGIRVKL